MRKSLCYIVDAVYPFTADGMQVPFDSPWLEDTPSSARLGLYTPRKTNTFKKVTDFVTGHPCRQKSIRPRTYSILFSQWCCRVIALGTLIGLEVALPLGEINLFFSFSSKEVPKSSEGPLVTARAQRGMLGWQTVSPSRHAPHLLQSPFPREQAFAESKMEINAFLVREGTNQAAVLIGENLWASGGDGPGKHGLAARWKNTICFPFHVWVV